MTYPDTGFLVSLYLNDANGEAATRYVERYGGPLLLSPLTRIEMANAFRLWEFRKLLTAANVRSVLRDIAEDTASGFLNETSVAWSDLLTTAERLSARYTPKTGNRTLDILHVAAAKALGIDTFLTFDKRQGVLATKAGLTAPLPAADL
ncbi:MAG: type II toxin-antitoxin system VapC family toxin [Verrucomicrobia bacterium]|jgi:predicted nucleic acid-binding protein|nr:type II toxin-antitoxin system VapC family toxin [Verrucomicrobiota bacterium]